jgi:hypothetical protein
MTKRLIAILVGVVAVLAVTPAAIAEPCIPLIRPWC